VCHTVHNVLAVSLLLEVVLPALVD